MSRSVSEPATHTSDQPDVYGPVESELAEVERILKSELRSDHPYVDELVRYGCLIGGKRLRPTLLLLTAKAIGEMKQAHLVLGAVVEMIHTATLVHDDVLDEADTRRHLATVNSRWDNKASVLLGDYLFTHSFYLASTIGSAWACQEIGRATNIVCEGELRQKGCRGDFALSESEYFEIIAAKTAELTACSCRLGAHYAGASEEVVEQLTKFGRDLGIAFQIVDDVLDLQGEEVTTGKSLGTDLEQQKPTLPIIHALANHSPEKREELLLLLSSDTAPSREALLPWLSEYDSIEYAYQTAKQFAASALKNLDCLEESDATNTLRLIASFVVERTR
ncbi:MAG: polyprenyl synthetase family protein [Planctomycetales bacterium]|nr:polyprenyl synthetase family protein [Planctomycetales bacterium]